MGAHAVHRTPRVGVELDKPMGKNDGAVGGHVYFSCDAGHGILVNPNKVKLLEEDTNVELGARVVIQGYPCIGTVRFVGTHHIKGTRERGGIKQGRA